MRWCAVEDRCSTRIYVAHCPSSGHFRDSWRQIRSIAGMRSKSRLVWICSPGVKQLRPTISADCPKSVQSARRKKWLSSLRALVSVVPEIGVEPTTFALRMGRTAYTATVRHTPQQLNQQVSTLTVCWCVLDCCGVFIPTVPKVSQKPPPGSRASPGLVGRVSHNPPTAKVYKISQISDYMLDTRGRERIRGSFAERPTAQPVNVISRIVGAASVGAVVVPPARPRQVTTNQCRAHRRNRRLQRQCRSGSAATRRESSRSRACSNRSATCREPSCREMPMLSCLWKPRSSILLDVRMQSPRRGQVPDVNQHPVGVGVVLDQTHRRSPASEHVSNACAPVATSM